MGSGVSPSASRHRRNQQMLQREGAAERGSASSGAFACPSWGPRPHPSFLVASELPSLSNQNLTQKMSLTQDCCSWKKMKKSRRQFASLLNTSPSSHCPTLKNRHAALNRSLTLAEQPSWKGVPYLMQLTSHPPGWVTNMHDTHFSTTC